MICTYKCFFNDKLIFSDNNFCEFRRTIYRTRKGKGDRIRIEIYVKPNLKKEDINRNIKNKIERINEGNDSRKIDIIMVFLFNKLLVSIKSTGKDIDWESDVICVDAKFWPIPCGYSR